MNKIGKLVCVILRPTVTQNKEYASKHDFLKHAQIKIRKLPFFGKINF